MFGPDVQLRSWPAAALFGSVADAGLHRHAHCTRAAAHWAARSQVDVSLDLRKIAAFIYLVASAPGVWLVASAQLGSCRARDQTRRRRTFLAGILGARAARDGTGTSCAELSAHGPVAGEACAPGAFALILCGLLELCAQSWAQKRHPPAGRSRAAEMAAKMRSRACFGALRSVGLSHDAVWVRRIECVGVVRILIVLCMMHVLT